ncbi:MAG TPA: FAD-binding protein [Sulfurovum sp.]|nr:FAD-binding protein [Sulfurovum sp.]
MLDCAIIGGGPAGLTAGLYATRGGLKNVTMFEKGMPGGQITQSSEIENYPGVFREGMTGLDLMEPWPNQCQHFGLKHDMKEVKSVSRSGDHFVLNVGKEQVEAKTVIVCTGSTPRRAGFKGEDEFFGKGVGTCATCDGFFYKNKEVAVLGGGDTALEEALYLANICSKVYVIHRREEFRAAPPTVERLMKNDKIELVLNASIDEAFGDAMGLNGLNIVFKDGTPPRTLDVPGVFVFVGNNVNNGVLKQEDGSFLCATNEQGEVIVDLNMNTDIEGLYAAGDMRINAAKQVVCAASDGAVAGMQALSHILEQA